MAVSLREQAAVLALVEASPREWFRTAAVIGDNGSAVRLLEGDLAPMDAKQRDYAEQLVAAVRPGGVERAQALIERVLAQGVELITVLDEHYPLNLQLVYNRPPFIWVRGRLDSASMRAIAVVGTRQAGTEGRATAARLARELSGVGVTVISGLARGIDTAAHTAALDSGGRTVAVIGTGILAATYPAENAELADRISEHGAVVSQFWPDAPPRRTNFPLRNVVMSGLAAGTVVVEASATSGAKMQARLALEHGKQLFLHEQLLKDQDWAKRYAQKPGVKVVRTFDDILGSLATLVDIPQQLPLAL